MNAQLLIEQALEARLKAYAPYSGFRVGAALLTVKGHIYTGCNIENAAYSPALCAERTAIAKAVSEGETAFRAIAVCGGYEDALEDCPPCGVCRQVFAEFCHPDTFQIIVAQSASDYTVYLLKELFPEHFGPRHIRV